MASLELQRLWKLAQVDNELADIRSKAMRLDAGEELKKLRNVFEADHGAELDCHKKITSDIADLELAQKSLEAKIKKFKSDLYSGKIAGAREAGAVEKEIAMLEKQRDRSDENLLELYEAQPLASKRSEAALKKLAEFDRQIAERQRSAQELKVKLEERFHALAQRRSEAVKAVPPGLLARYDATRKAHAGIGMVIVTKSHECSGCSTHLPEKIIDMLKNDLIVNCESCRRFLYYTEGLI